MFDCRHALPQGLLPQVLSLPFLQSVKMMCNFISVEDWHLASQMAKAGRLRSLKHMHVIVLKPVPIPFGIYENFDAASEGMLTIFTNSPQMVEHSNCSLMYA